MTLLWHKTISRLICFIVQSTIVLQKSKWYVDLSGNIICLILLFPLTKNNGFVCNICNLFFELGQREAFFRDVRGHFRNPRNDYEDPFRCKAPNCGYSALRLHSFKVHVETTHPNGMFSTFLKPLFIILFYLGYNLQNNVNHQYELDVHDVDVQENDPMGIENVDAENQDHENIDIEFVVNEAQDRRQQILCEKYFINKFLDLFGRKDTSMQVAIDHIGMIKEIMQCARADIQIKLEHHQDAAQIANLYFNNVITTMSSVDTQCKLEKYLKDLEYFKEGEKINIEYNEKDIRLTLFPLSHSIKNFLQLPNVLNSIIENQRFLREKSINDNTLYNIINGPLWNSVLERFREDEIVIPLFLYEDDFNPDNGLGPHKADTELAAFYVSFPTLNNHVKDSTDHIFTLLMTKSAYLKAYTDIILLRVVEQLVALEEGIIVNLDTGPQRVHLITIAITGDNVAQNLIGGFPKALNSNGFCRVCTINRVDWLVTTQENPNLLRNENNYIYGEYGIRELSLLNNLGHYTVFQNQTVDIVHDWLLGTYKDDIYLIVIRLLNIDGITLEVINNCIKNFDYGFKHRQYKIPMITENNITSEKIPGYAREIMNTVNYLPFILNNFLEYNDPVYNFSLLMVDILDEITKPLTNVEYSTHLNTLITQHNEAKINLFNTTLKPKNHITTHYGRISLKCGPLKDLWTFSFERKHQVIKSYLVNSKNRINTTYSVSKKIAYEEARQFYNKTNIFRKIRSYGKLIPEPLYYNGVLNLPNLRVVQKVEFYGTDYRLGDFIFSNDKTSIHEIKEILISLHNDSAFVVTEMFNILYVDHLRSFQLQASLNEIVTNNIEAFDFPPINSHLFREEIFFRFKCFY